MKVAFHFIKACTFCYIVSKTTNKQTFLGTEQKDILNMYTMYIDVSPMSIVSNQMEEYIISLRVHMPNELMLKVHRPDDRYNSNTIRIFVSNVLFDYS